MLRSLVLILLIVNAVFLAWSQGWLNQVIGVQPNAQHEPQRMAQQVHADKIVVLGQQATDPAGGSASAVPPVGDVPAASGAALGAASVAASSASSASSAPGNAWPLPASAPSADVSNAAATTQAGGASAAPAAGLCLEAGPFSASEYASVDALLKPVLPAGTWASQTVLIQGLWLVYMGPYADADMLERKQVELRRIRGLNFEEVRTPASLAQGLSLGRYTKLEDAEAALNTLRIRGIRTARIVTIRPNMEVQVVRVARATVDMQVSLSGIKLPQGKGFTACRR